MLPQQEEKEQGILWPPGSGEMAKRIRAYDWSATALGPFEGWPSHLRSAVDVMLSCGFPTTLQWGDELTLLYNDAYIPLIGPRHPFALGKPLLETFPEIRPVYGALAERVRGGETVVLEDQLFRYVRQDELADSWFNLSYSPIHAPDGSTAGILAIGLETTARILAERARSTMDVALRQSEQRMKRVLETDAVGVLFFNMEGTVVDANGVFMRMTGYTQEDIAAGKLHWRVMTPPEYVAISEAQMKRFAETGRIGPYEKEYILKDGSRRWMLFAGRALGDGTIAEYCIDVTDRHRTEEALNQSERYFRALVSATSEVVYRLSPDWSEMRALRGSGFLSDTDLPESNWLGRYIHPGDRAQVIEAMNDAIRKKHTFELEHRVIRADGSVGWTFSRAIPLLDADGNITEWFGAATDVTRRKLAESGMRENEKLAVVGRLASSIAHEINNPLEAVVNLVYLAQRDSTAEARSYLDQAQMELARITHIATETLRFNRRNTRASATNISEVVDSVLTLHEGRIRGSQISVSRRYSEHGPIMVFANELRQVIANLVGNAVDAMAESERRRLFLRVREARDPRSGHAGVRLTVADTGTGMTDATLRRLYEPFFTTKESTGTGLGLWVTQEIVRKHHGTMRVRSGQRRHRSGTVFTVFLPSMRETAST